MRLRRISLPHMNRRLNDPWKRVDGGRGGAVALGGGSRFSNLYIEEDEEEDEVKQNGASVLFTNPSLN